MVLGVGAAVGTTTWDCEEAWERMTRVTGDTERFIFFPEGGASERFIFS
jgi:hypothetical protein